MELKDKYGFTGKDYAYLAAFVNERINRTFPYEDRRRYYEKRAEQLYSENPERFEKIVRENS